MGISLNYILNGSYESLWNIISMVILYALLQCIKCCFTCWHHIQRGMGRIFQYFLAATKALVFLQWVYVEYQDEIISVNLTNYYLGPMEAFGKLQPTWYNPDFKPFPVVTSAAKHVVLYLVSGLLVI